MLTKIFKFHLVFFAFFLLFVTFGKSDCYAYFDVHAASVALVGPSDKFPNNVFVTLVNKTTATIGGVWAPNDERSFYLHQSIANQGMATLLTALASNKTVFVRLYDIKPGSLIYIIYTR